MFDDQESPADVYLIGLLPCIQGYIPDRAVIALVCDINIGDQDINWTKVAAGL